MTCAMIVSAVMATKPISGSATSADESRAAAAQPRTEAHGDGGESAGPRQGGDRQRERNCAKQRNTHDRNRQSEDNRHQPRHEQHFRNRTEQPRAQR
jgi:hypothetical protein